MRRPRTEVMVLHVGQIWNQIPTVVLANPPQHVRGGLERALGEEGLNFSGLDVGGSAEEGVFVEAFPTSAASGERRPEARADHVTETCLLHQTDGAGLADAADGQHDVQTDA